MPDDAAPRAAVIAAMSDDGGYGRSDQVFGQLHAAFAAGARFQLYPTASHAALIPLPRR